ncbi:uncharacterized protein A4U43_C06F10760 [Asparagus officinalis]|uniref:Chalcone-flavonone isomerase family protein n=1 Tax=Asparagus officinalis TaxID=4686 RepID=A0A5P1ERM5_ASPOF|nr:uncharacterized protein A4U43_C06F10760 [Asparagus officinalis]
MKFVLEAKWVFFGSQCFAVGSTEYVIEPATDVKFPKELTVPGCLDSLILLGTGYREKVFAIIGVKVYASGFYANYSIRELSESWKGKSADDVLKDSSVFISIFHAPFAKSLKIMLVRDVDGKTFWNALNDVISPRIKEPTAVDESALSNFRNTFQGRDLNKGTLILLTWIEPSKMLVSISSDGFPSNIDAEIESVNVTSSLFDAFFGESPVSPTLKASVSNGLLAVLN